MENHSGIILVSNAKEGLKHFHVSSSGVTPFHRKNCFLSDS